MLIVGGCYLFGWVISNERWAVSVTNMLVGLHTSLAVKLLLVNLVLLVVGMFMDSAPAIMLVAPILAPAMASLGVDPIQPEPDHRSGNSAGRCLLIHGNQYCKMQIWRYGSKCSTIPGSDAGSISDYYECSGSIQNSIYFNGTIETRGDVEVGRSLFLYKNTNQK